MLRGVIGDSAFWAGIQSYYDEFQDLNATTADFRRHMEEASGMELGRFFQQWLYEGGMLRLDGGWHYDASSRSIEVELDQGQDDGDVFELPIQIAIDIDGDRRIETLQLDGIRGVFTLPVDGEPDSVTLDPDTWVLAVTSFEHR